MKKYYRIKGEYGVYILTQREMDIALDRENQRIKIKKGDKILTEKEY